MVMEAMCTNLANELGHHLVGVDLFCSPSGPEVFRVRVMDANKVAVDGNLWLPGEEVGGDKTTTSLRPHWKSLVNKGNHPQMALIQISELF